MAIDLDAAKLADCQTRLLGEADVRFYADRKDDHIGNQLLSGAKIYNKLLVPART